MTDKQFIRKVLRLEKKQKKVYAELYELKKKATEKQKNIIQNAYIDYS